MKKTREEALQFPPVHLQNISDPVFNPRILGCFSESGLRVFAPQQIEAEVDDPPPEKRFFLVPAVK